MARCARTRYDSSSAIPSVRATAAPSSRSRSTIDRAGERYSSPTDEFTSAATGFAAALITAFSHTRSSICSSYCVPSPASVSTDAICRDASALPGPGAPIACGGLLKVIFTLRRSASIRAPSDRTIRSTRWSPSRSIRYRPGSIPF